MTARKPSLLDPAFHYVPSHASDIRRTFARERKRIAAAQQAKAERETHESADTRRVLDIFESRRVK